MRTHLTILTILVALLAPAVCDAQGRGTGQFPRGGRGQRPPRDAVQAPPQRTGTASISGRVLTADTSRPVKRASVLVSLTGGGRPLAFLTDETGQYQARGLPAGTFTVTAHKPGFIESAFGQRRAMRGGTPIQVAEGQQLTNINLALTRGAVITGHILDEDGEPLARTMVQVLRYQYQRGERRLVPAGSDQSDDRGQYRVFGLRPGDYAISATAMPEGAARRVLITPAPQSVGFDDATQSTGYAPTYYPGVIAPDQKSLVRLTAAQELTGVDFQLRLVPLATVRGTTSEPRGFVQLVPDDGGGFPRMQRWRGPVLQDGSFSIHNVPPGKYIAIARADEAPGTATMAMQSVVVSGEDVAVSLSPVRGSRVGGVMTLESAAPPKSFAGFRVSARLLGAGVVVPRWTSPAEADETGHFTLTDLVPGQYVVQANAPRGWTIKAVYLDGRDVTDHPLEIRGGDSPNGLNVIFTNKVSSVSGSVTATSDMPAAGITVIAFPSDERLWRSATRRIQSAVGDQNGAYRFNDLPAGEYLLVATDDVEQDEWFDPAFLESVRDKAVRVTLGEGEQKVLALKAS